MRRSGNLGLAKERQLAKAKRVLASNERKPFAREVELPYLLPLQRRNRRELHASGRSLRNRVMGVQVSELLWRSGAASVDSARKEVATVHGPTSGSRL